jgi:hypothetical protein
MTERPRCSTCDRLIVNDEHTFENGIAFCTHMMRTWSMNNRVPCSCKAYISREEEARQQRIS